MDIETLPCLEKLSAIGLSKYEALAYLALLKKNHTPALNIADRAGIPRQRIYDVLNNLQTKGLCFAQAGRPRSYGAYPPKRALTASLNYRKQQQAAENERQARLIEEVIPVLNTVYHAQNSQPAPVPNPAPGNGPGPERDIGGL
ncbi:MAG: TrmB family transcriptional regulator [Anaerolineae bacterium]